LRERQGGIVENPVRERRRQVIVEHLSIVNIAGNPRVLLAVPIPVPVETHTLWHGYGYLGG